MNATIRNFLLTAVMITLLFAAKSSQAAIITVPPGNWVFQNTQTVTASDVHVFIEGPGPYMPDIDPGRSTGGAPFPNLGTNMPGPGHIEFRGPPGIPAGGFYGLSFPDWPVGTQFDVVFSYPLGILLSPGRVYQQIGLGLGPTDFEFVAALSSEPFAPLPANFDFLSSSGQIVTISEPATLALFSLGVAGLGFFSKRRKVR